jgi:hypothetical protein
MCGLQLTTTIHEHGTSTTVTTFILYTSSFILPDAHEHEHVSSPIHEHVFYPLSFCLYPLKTRPRQFSEHDHGFSLYPFEGMVNEAAR